MIVLGIETSCDETSAAVYDTEGGLRSNVILSQTEHGIYGGVVPEIASRAHLKTILPVVREALVRAGIPLDEVGGVAVTRGPGLVGSLLVGISVAKAISFSKGIPLIGVHHLEGHIFAIFIEHPELSPPFVVLIASGGHTQLVYVPELGRYETLGRTLDDAAGEAFDKVAKVLELGYPGGPIIDKLASEGNPAAVDFPRAYMGRGNLDFSFSGIKTAVINHVMGIRPEKLSASIPDIAAAFQAAVVDVLVDKTLAAAELKGADKVVLVGGVAANSELRRRLDLRSKSTGISVFHPSPKLCTDNAAMVALAGAFRLSRGERSGYDMNAEPRLEL